MYLLASIVLSALFINPSAIEMETLKTNSTINVIIDKQLGYVSEEVAVIEGTKVETMNDKDTIKVVKIQLDFDFFFKPGESNLNNAMKDDLTKLSEILIKNPTSVITIVGHTDNISTFEINQKLSESRAQVLADFLLTKNVPSAQLKEISGKNYADPLADNSTQAGRAINRRAEVHVISSPIVMNTLVTSALPKDSIKIKRLPASLIKLVEEVVKQSSKLTEVEIELDGLLVDETKTKAGKDFYDLFYGSWEAPAGAKNYTITVSEKPFRLSSTQIVVSINDNTVYQAILQPRQDIIEALSVDAISNTQSYLANYEEIMKQLNGDDMEGSGIF